MSEAPKAPWIVRIKRRRDGKKYYYRHDYCLTARKESSLRLDECTAEQLSYAISSQHPDFYAWAVPYDAKHPKKKKDAAAASRRAESITIARDSVDVRLICEDGGTK